MADRASQALNPGAMEYIPQRNLLTQDPSFPLYHQPRQHIFVSHPLNYSFINHHPYSLTPPPPPPPQIIAVNPQHGYDPTAVVTHPPPRITNPTVNASVDQARVSTGQTSNNTRRVFKKRNKINGRYWRPRSKLVYVEKADSSQKPSGANDTTLMIRNIPSKYTRQMLMEFLDEHCKLQNNKSSVQHAYDFLYMPIDFRTELNKGYAFVNFTSPEAASEFEEKTKGQGWPHFNSKKIREIAKAKLQGKDEMIRNYKNMRFACEQAEFLPVLFTPARDGTNQDLVKAQTVGIYIGN